MSHFIKDCSGCGARFPTEYARLVHECPKSNSESDSKLSAWLKNALPHEEGDFKEVIRREK